MSSDQLRWHLLNEMSEILVRRLDRRDDGVPLFNLLMSGKGPARTVRMVVSERVEIVEWLQHSSIRVVSNSKTRRIEPVYFQKLVLQWTPFLYLKLFINDDSIPKLPDTPSYQDTPAYVNALQDGNCIEKIAFDSQSGAKTAVAIINACPNLSRLSGHRTLLSLLLQRGDVNLTMMRSIHIKNHSLDTSDEHKRIFEALTKHPERFPHFETLKVTIVDRLSDMLTIMSAFVFRTVQSLKIQVSGGNDPPAYFPLVASIPQSFPNIEDVCLTVRELYTDARSMKPIQMFNDFECSFNFKFIYNLKYYQPYSDGAKVQSFKALENVLSAHGMNNCVDKRECAATYAVTESYPNKTMEFELKARVTFAYIRRRR